MEGREGGVAESGRTVSKETTMAQPKGYVDPEYPK